MSNVVQMFAPSPPESENPVNDFIRDEYQHWCEDHGIDTDSMNYKLNTAAVMSIMKAMLVDED